MANFNLIMIDKFKDLATIEVLHGKIIYVEDVREIYYDSESGIRSATNNIVIIDSLEAAEAILLPDLYRIYVIKSTAVVYRYIEYVWTEITNPAEVDDIFSEYASFTPATIEQSGVNFAPRTLSSCVLLESGESLENKLNNIAKMQVITDRYTVEAPDQLIIDLPLPFENYFENGNFMMVFIGSVLVDDRRYMINTQNKLVFLSYEDTVEAGREITFIFYYNTYNANTTAVSSNIDGRYIMNRSIPYNKIQRLSSAYNHNDETSLATSKSVYSLYTKVVEMLSTATNNIITYCTAVGNGISIKTTLLNYVLQDNAIIKIRLNVPLGNSATLAINDGASYPIYNGTLPITSGMGTGEVLELVFSAVDSKFYMTNGVGHKLISTTSIYTVESDTEESIPINISPFNPYTDNLRVYQNNLRLFKDLNYSISDNNIILLGYTACKDDVFYFEIDTIVKEVI